MFATKRNWDPNKNSITANPLTENFKYSLSFLPGMVKANIQYIKRTVLKIPAAEIEYHFEISYKKYAGVVYKQLILLTNENEIRAQALLGEVFFDVFKKGKISISMPDTLTYIDFARAMAKVLVRHGFQQHKILESFGVKRQFCNDLSPVQILKTQNKN